MTNVTTVYDTVKATVASLYPSKTQLFNSINVNDNPDFVLKDGYGVAVGSSSAPDIQFNTIAQSRAFDITLTKRVVKSDENTTAMDTQVKALLEELNTLHLDFCNADELTISSNLDGITIGDCSPIQFIFGESERFIFITQTINILWQENL